MNQIEILLTEENRILTEKLKQAPANVAREILHTLTLTNSYCRVFEKIFREEDLTLEDGEILATSLRSCFIAFDKKEIGNTFELTSENCLNYKKADLFEDIHIGDIVKIVVPAVRYEMDKIMLPKITKA